MAAAAGKWFVVCTTTAVGLLEPVDLAVGQSAACVAMTVLRHRGGDAAVRRDDDMEFLGGNLERTHRCTDQTVGLVVRVKVYR